MRPIPSKSPLDHRELIETAFEPMKFRDTGTGTLVSVDGTTTDQQDIMDFLERRGAISGKFASANVNGSFIEITAVDPATLAGATELMNCAERQRAFASACRALSTLTGGLPWTFGKTGITLETGVGSEVDREKMGPLVMTQLETLRDRGILEFHLMDGRPYVTEVSTNAPALLGNMMPRPKISGPAGLPAATTRAMHEVAAERARLSQTQAGLMNLVTITEKVGARPGF